MHCKPGKVAPLVKKFKELAKVLKKMGYNSPMRILTDISGECYWTMVAEQEVKSLEEYTDMSRTTMSEPKIQKAMKGYHDLVASGRREIYKIEK
jgi:hypothetical protein